MIRRPYHVLFNGGPYDGLLKSFSMRTWAIDVVMYEGDTAFCVCQYVYATTIQVDNEPLSIFNYKT